MEDIISKLAIYSIKVNDYISKREKDGIINVFVFKQTWGSTCLGFGGIGGSAMTDAWTHVVQTYGGKFHVFFAGMYAYSVETPTEEFKKDLGKQCMKSVDEAKKFY
jgi:hypothetical protein